MHLVTHFSCLSGYAILLATVVVTSTALHLENLNKDSSSENSLFDQRLNGAASMSKSYKQEKSDHLRKRQSFSVTQDLDALAEMLREASRRRRLQNAIAFFNALKKRDTESTYGYQFPEELSKNEQ